VFSIRPDLRLMGFPLQPSAEEVPGSGPNDLALMRGATGSGGFNPSGSTSPFTPPDGPSHLPYSFLAPRSYDGPYGPIPITPDRVSFSGQSGPSYVPTSVAAALTQPFLDLRIERQPGIKAVPDAAPSPSPEPPSWMDRNMLGIPPELLRDPSYFHIEVPGEVPPRIEYWPRRHWNR
jgi:hypothetical protein